MLSDSLASVGTWLKTLKNYQWLVRAACCVVWLFTGRGVNEVWNRDRFCPRFKQRLARQSLMELMVSKPVPAPLPFVHQRNAGSSLPPFAGCSVTSPAEAETRGRVGRKSTLGVCVQTCVVLQFSPDPKTSSSPRVIFISGQVHYSDIILSALLMWL